MRDLPPDHHVALRAAELPPGQVREVFLAGRSVAVANVGGVFPALAGTCPHAQGPLAEGRLEGSVLTCPQHGWTFDVRDGSCAVSPEDGIASFPVELIDGAVCVRIQR